MLPCQVMLAHAGDAKGVLARVPEAGGGIQSSAPKAFTLTKEHKAIFASERTRIQKAGGHVEKGRLAGMAMFLTSSDSNHQTWSHTSLLVLL